MQIQHVKQLGDLYTPYKSQCGPLLRFTERIMDTKISQDKFMLQHSITLPSTALKIYKILVHGTQQTDRSIKFCATHFA